MASSIPLEVQHAKNGEDGEERRLKTMWEEKFKDLEEKFIKELAENNETREKQVKRLKLEIHNKDEEIQFLKQIKDRSHEIQIKDLRQLNTMIAEFNKTKIDHEEKLRALEKKFIQDMTKDNENWKEQMNQVKLKLQRKDDTDMTQKCLKMQQEIKLLEKMCLYQKSRRGFFFRRKIQDSKTVLERMKSKMKDKEKKEKKEEEAGCSAQTGHQ